MDELKLEHFLSGWESFFEDCEECARVCAEMHPGLQLCPNDVRIRDHYCDVLEFRRTVAEARATLSDNTRL